MEAENEEFTYRQIYEYIKNGKYPKYSRKLCNKLAHQKTSQFLRLLIMEQFDKLYCYHQGTGDERSFQKTAKRKMCGGESDNFQQRYQNVPIIF